ncbi:JAB domain-containing protein, partial [Acinetobacter baumannii]|uniref:JAB domain-containing protein n=1 Tax=Acinetobacter baumannii TaxID=470 RepID=UPI003AF87704
ELRKLHFKKLLFGSVQHCAVSVNHTLRYALQQHACQLVLAHNHPFGSPQPSPEDLKLTQQLEQACQLVEIRLLDHCIISPEGRVSGAEE